MIGTDMTIFSSRTGSPRLRRLLPAMAALLLCGCTVGPDFVRPTPAAPDATWQELKRRCGWEWNGMRLHEYYFDGLVAGASQLSADNAFARAVTAQFGSIEAWKADLAGVAKMPGVGWALTYLDQNNGQIWNHWVEAHQDGHPAGARLLLALDVWEHAFSVYRTPLERPAYIDDFFANVNWDLVASRLP